MKQKERTKWNRDVVEFLCGSMDTYDVERLTETHLRLTRHRDGAQLDYFPKSSKGNWLGFTPPVFFIIHDIERYINQKFPR